MNTSKNFFRLLMVLCVAGLLATFCKNNTDPPCEWDDCICWGINCVDECELTVADCPHGVNEDDCKCIIREDDPVIKSFQPSTGKSGTDVIIEGKNFTSVIADITVTINGVPIPIKNANEEQIVVTIPQNWRIGTGQIQVKIEGKTPATSNAEFSYLMKRIVTTVGRPKESGFENGAANEARFNFSHDRRGGIAVDDDLNIYVAEPENASIRKITPPDFEVSSFIDMSEYTNDWSVSWRWNNGTPVSPSMNSVIKSHALAIDKEGNLYTFDNDIGIVKITPDKIAWHGNGWGKDFDYLAVDDENRRLYMYRRDGTLWHKSLDTWGSAQETFEPVQIINFSQSAGAGGVAVGKNGDVYVSSINKILKYKFEEWNSTIDVAGTGDASYLDGAGHSAKFDGPWGLAIDDDGNLFVAGSGGGGTSDHSIRYINTATEYVTTFAGTATKGHKDDEFNPDSYAGVDNSKGVVVMPVMFDTPTDVAVDKFGTVYVLDRLNHVIRIIKTE